MIFEIWMEGFVITGASSNATFLGAYLANNFKEACQKAVERHQYHEDYNKEKNTVWGCRLFDDEAKARESFG